MRSLWVGLAGPGERGDLGCGEVCPSAAEGLEGDAGDTGEAGEWDLGGGTFTSKRGLASTYSCSGQETHQHDASTLLGIVSDQVLCSPHCSVFLLETTLCHWSEMVIGDKSTNQNVVVFGLLVHKLMQLGLTHRLCTRALWDIPLELRQVYHIDVGGGRPIGCALHTGGGYRRTQRLGGLRVFVLCHSLLLCQKTTCSARLTLHAVHFSSSTHRTLS